jgi:hypothetical protein
VSVRLAPVLTALALALAASGAQAANIVGGSTLLTSSSAAQLEAWLGEGSITLTNIFTKQSGDTSFSFHNAADGKGRTFVVLYATEGNTGNSAIIGGYNNASWNSNSTYEYDFNPGDANESFVFNLSSGVKKAQTGIYTTYNAPNYGPTFGGGHDIYVDSTLSTGYSYGYSYGGVSVQSLVDGSGYDGYDVTYGAIEVFTISASTVPEPAALGLACVGLCVVGVASRHKARNKAQTA